MTAEHLVLDSDLSDLLQAPDTSEPEAQDAPKIPGYQLLQRLEDGAWRARQVSTGQTVRVKVFGQMNATQMRDLSRAVQLGSHPYLANILEAQLQHQPPFLVTSLLHSSLASWMKVHAHSAELNDRTSNWLQQAAQGLSFLHQRLIYHGDLRPQNLWLDSREALRLADLGQSYHLAERMPSESLFLVAPEQILTIRDRIRKPEASWDIYSLGATFYYLLTSFYPRATFRGLRRLEHCASGPERLRECWTQMHCSPLVPVLDYNPSVQVRLAIVIERCLALDPLHRYRQARDLLADLELRDQMPEHGLDHAIYGLRRLTYRLGL